MHAVTSVLQEIFPKLEQKFLQKVRQDLLFVVGKRARGGRERERESARRMCRAHRSSATGDKLSTRAVTDERTDGRTDGRMDDSTRAMTDGCFNAVTAVENQSFVRSFPFSTKAFYTGQPFSHCLPNQHVVFIR